MTFNFFQKIRDIKNFSKHFVPEEEDEDDFNKLLEDKRHKKKFLNVLKRNSIISIKDEPNSYDFTKIRKYSKKNLLIIE